MEMGYEYSVIESVDMKTQKDPQNAAYEILGCWLAGSEGLCEPVTWSSGVATPPGPGPTRAQVLVDFVCALVKLPYSQV